MTTDLNKQLDNVNSKDKLVNFIDALRDNLRTDSDAWENDRLDTFLEALSAWLRDERYLLGILQEPIGQGAVWKTIATALIAARSYE